jgi:hypothetical protein
MPLILDTSEFIPTQREKSRIEIDKILDSYLEPLVKNTIVAEIKALGYAANVPQSFIDGVKFIKTEKNRGIIINTWGTKERPLAIFFNYGTVQHWIEPTEAEALAWSSTAGQNPQAIFFRGESKEGDMLFSKGHYVSGVPRTEVMERGFNIGKKRLAVEAGNIVRNELG